MIADRRPVILRAVCLVVLLEAAAFVVLGAVLVVGLANGSSALPAASAFLALFAVGVAAVLGVSARGLWRGRRWARSPVMTWQIMLVVLALGWFGVEASWWSALVVAVALATGVGLLVPSVVAATVPTDARGAGGAPDGTARPDGPARRGGTT